MDAMNVQDYKKTITVNATPQKVFESLTTEIEGWWTNGYQGNAAHIGDEFRVYFAQIHDTTFSIEELVPNQKVVWLCTKAHINLPEVTVHDEWKGTRMIWTIGADGDKTTLTLHHEGLNNTVQCFDSCTQGWNEFFAASLYSFLETGTGKPFKNEAVA
jgi:uncharacterized protein YndB with AHSA1/START domain